MAGDQVNLGEQVREDEIVERESYLRFVWGAMNLLCV